MQQSKILIDILLVSFHLATFRSPDLSIWRQNYQGSTETNDKYYLWYRFKSNGEIRRVFIFYIQNYKKKSKKYLQNSVENCLKS